MPRPATAACSNASVSSLRSVPRIGSAAPRCTPAKHHHPGDVLEAIVTRVLSFAKAPSSLHSRWSVAEIVEDTIVLIRLKLAQSKIHLHFLPPARPLVIDAHKGQLQQVLLNLLINATQAMPDGGSITISAGTEERNGVPYAAIDITDTGHGIPETIRDRIFDSFLSGRPDGTGLGLFMAKKVIVAEGGSIIFDSKEGKGSTFGFSFPLSKIKTEADPAGQPAIN